MSQITVGWNVASIGMSLGPLCGSLDDLSWCGERGRDYSQFGPTNEGNRWARRWIFRDHRGGGDGGYTCVVGFSICCRSCRSNRFGLQDCWGQVDVKSSGAVVPTVDMNFLQAYFCVGFATLLPLSVGACIGIVPRKPKCDFFVPGASNQWYYSCHRQNLCHG
jgi:hypothetical protein